MSNKILERFKESIKATQFNAIKLSLSSPEQIRSLSYGEVKKIETINYRTLKPERDGLFCPRIFGPVQDWACICGKYKRMKHRGIVCEKCGVEVIECRVRRERMGHIELAAPVAHLWYLKGTPSYLSLILDMTVRDLERIIYFEAYIVTASGKSQYPVRTILTNNEREAYLDKHPEDTVFSAKMGAEAIKQILEELDLGLEIAVLQSEYAKTNSIVIRTKLMKRIKVLSSLESANLRPEWMILSAFPVLPPDLRPLVPLEGGRFASSDLNELYRRIINRNVRLSRLLEIQAPSVIIKNEKRMLQESVDAFIDNGRRAQPVRANKRPLKSLSEMLRGKQGRFRQNLLGKRVDYSGRSVIVVDPELKIDQCGLPKLMALELFKSHVLSELIKREIAPNIRIARKIVEDMEPAAWDALEDIVKNYPILLNRAPTLHRLGIQAFYPTLVDSKAIKIHPLVTASYNADFDGDQMGVYIPLSSKAKQECKELIMSSKNLLSPQNARPVLIPSQEMILGLHYLTKMRCNVLGEGMIFASINELVTAYECKAVHLHASIKVRIKNTIVNTTVGRAILFSHLPEDSDIEWINKILNRNDVIKLIELVYFNFGTEKTVKMLDNIKSLGFNAATRSGISFSIEYLIDPSNRENIIAKAELEILQIEKDYQSGKITSAERYSKILQTWDAATAHVAGDMLHDLDAQNQKAFENKDGKEQEFNFLFMALDSKARGSTEQIKQLIGMRGLMSKPSGEIMETPVKSNFKKGLNVFEYFVSTHGARKGQADTALKTANAGYLTRRLVDVAQDVIVSMNDCRTTDFIEFESLSESGDTLLALPQRVYGKIAMQDIRDPITQELIVPHGALINREDTENLKNSAVTKIRVRSVVKCQAKRGICAKCYGMDLSKDALVDVGTSVGIIAAQSIGEPGTQLTMKTFHVGGTASIGEQSSFIAKHDGIIKLLFAKFVVNREGKKIIVSRKARLAIMSPDGRELQKHAIEYGSVIYAEDGQAIKKGTKLLEWDQNNKTVITEVKGIVDFIDLVPNITVQNRYDDATNKATTVILDHRGDKYQPAAIIKNPLTGEASNYFLPVGSILAVEAGQSIEPGDILVKLPREASKTKDITGGLPRIAELFEARLPKDPCVLAEIDGEIVIGALHRGLRKISIVGRNQTVDYAISRTKQLNVSHGDFVHAGDQLTSGSPVLHDILSILGIDQAQYYLVNQIQGIYRSQGININDRHFELIVRQMTRKMRIIEPGDTNFLIGDRVDRIHLNHINEALVEEGKKPARGRNMLMGITLASLGTESFISAASFQETTRILSEAAVSGQVDYLYGLKENVIIGKLIPAGTGMTSFKKKYLEHNDGYANDGEKQKNGV